MKITHKQLKRLIREEVSTLTEARTKDVVADALDAVFESLSEVTEWAGNLSDEKKSMSTVALVTIKKFYGNLSSDGRWKKLVAEKGITKKVTFGR